MATVALHAAADLLVEYVDGKIEPSAGQSKADLFNAVLANVKAAVSLGLRENIVTAIDNLILRIAFQESPKLTKKELLGVHRLAASRLVWDTAHFAAMLNGSRLPPRPKGYDGWPAGGLLLSLQNCSAEQLSKFLMAARLLVVTENASALVELIDSALYDRVEPEVVSA